MESVLERLPSGARVSLIRLRSLGDCVLTTPAIRLLKAFRPDLQLAVVVEPRFSAVFENNPDIAQLLAPSIPLLAKVVPDLLLNLHGGTSSIVLTLASRARIRAGFAHFRAQAAYNVQIPTAQEILGVDRKVHTAEHLASAMFYLGVPPGEIPPACVFPKRLEDRRPFAILHPFASQPDKAWPAERFVAVARALEAMELQPLVLCGPGENPEHLPGIECLHRLPLDRAMSYIAAAAVFVGNDSGPAHIAAACGTPAVVLFGASDAVIWAPWKAPHAMQIARDTIADIPVEDVLTAIAKLRVAA